jgi:hypothetical protein
MATGLVGRRTRRLVLLFGLVVGSCGLLGFAAVASAHHAKTHHFRNGPLCNSFFSSAFLTTTLTDGWAMEPGPAQDTGPYEPAPPGVLKGGKPNPDAWDAPTHDPIRASEIAGSDCEWQDVYSVMFDTQAVQVFFTVGYGYTEKAWKDLWSASNLAARGGYPIPAFSSGFGVLLSTNPVGTDEYVQTFDLSGEGDPTSRVYSVTAMTRRHDVLNLAVLDFRQNPPESTVESAVSAILAANPSF